MNNLDSSALYSLEQLEQNGTGRSASLARSLLRLNGIETAYEPPRYLPEGTVAYKSMVDNTSRPSEAPSSFKLYPNPADDHVILQWNWFKEGINSELILRISDMQGKVLSEQKIKDYRKNNELIITKAFAPGTYLVEILQGDERVYISRLGKQ